MWNRCKNLGVQVHCRFNFFFHICLIIVILLIQSTASTVILESNSMFYQLGCIVWICSQPATKLVISVSIISGTCLSVAWYQEVFVYCTVQFVHVLSKPMATGEPLNTTYKHYYKEFLSVEKIPLPLSEMSNSITFSAYMMC